MNLYEMYETDIGKETSGFWHDMPKPSKASFLLARAGGANMKFVKAMEVKSRPHRGRGGALEDTSLDADVDVELATGLTREAFAETIVLDWKGVVDRNDKKVNWSKEASVKLLNDLPDLYIELRDVASKVSNFRIEGIKADVKN